jgi:hypothetical protein
MMVPNTISTIPSSEARQVRPQCRCSQKECKQVIRANIVFEHPVAFHFIHINVTVYCNKLLHRKTGQHTTGVDKQKAGAHEITDAISHE